MSLLAVLLVAESALAAPPPMSILNPRHYVCLRAEAPLHIDGKIDKSEWKKAAWTEDFVDIEGDKKPKPRFRTRAKMLWDDSCLYIAAEMEEPHVWATLKKHDEIVFYDPDFEVFLQPCWDKGQYYELEMNALNTTWDLMQTKPYRDGGQPVHNWDYRGLRTAVCVQGTINDARDIDSGWTAEIAIPWTAIHEYFDIPGQSYDPKRKYKPQEGEQWRINFSRVEHQIEVVGGEYLKKPRTPEDNWVWSPQEAVDMHRPEHWGYLQLTARPFSQGEFVPDPSAPARDTLFRIYYAERTFREGHGRWAPLEALKLGDLTQGGLVESPEIFTTPNLFEARVKVKYPDGSWHTWSIAQDSRVWETT